MCRVKIKQQLLNYSIIYTIIYTVDRIYGQYNNQYDIEYQYKYGCQPVGLGGHRGESPW